MVLSAEPVSGLVCVVNGLFWRKTVFESKLLLKSVCKQLAFLAWYIQMDKSIFNGYFSRLMGLIDRALKIKGKFELVCK